MEKKYPVGDLQIDIMQIVKDKKLILTVHTSMSCYLQNSSRLIFVQWSVSCTKTLTPPFLRRFPAKCSAKIYIGSHI